MAHTLFKRLFILMWAALVVSHLVAFLVVTQWAMTIPGLRADGSSIESIGLPNHR